MSGHADVKKQEVQEEGAAPLRCGGAQERCEPSWGGMSFPPGDLDDLIFHDAIIVRHSER